ncbi:MAG: hypothetical protein KTR15_08055 [Phycisphaeraceae bacterium]|nr:hypothetical protein [Phycisphaeraceae bacterium]
MIRLGKQPDPQHRGYALLVTLVMLALLGVILSGLARRSADTALQAREAEQSVRQHWAEMSCSYSLLSTASTRADDRLSVWQTAVKDGGHAIFSEPIKRQEAFKLKLAGLEVWGRIDDEQAKLNLNERLRTSPNSTVMPSAVLDEAISPSRTTGLRLTRQPFIETLGLQPLMSWPQVLPDYSPEDLLGIDHPEWLQVSSGPQPIANRITLWGDGTLNIWTAEDPVIRKRLQDLVQSSTIETLLRLRAEEPSLSLGTLLENADERAGLNRVFIERSGCHGMWLAVRPVNHGETPPQWSFWVVDQGGDREQGKLKAFRW